MDCQSYEGGCGMHPPLGTVFKELQRIYGCGGCNETYTSLTRHIEHTVAAAIESWSLRDRFDRTESHNLSEDKTPFQS